MLKLRERGKKFEKKKREKKNEKKSGQGARAAELLSTSTRSREKVCRPNPSSPCPFSPRKRHYPQQQYRARPPESFVRLETRVRCKGNPPSATSPISRLQRAPPPPHTPLSIFSRIAFLPRLQKCHRDQSPLSRSRTMQTISMHAVSSTKRDKAAKRVVRGSGKVAQKKMVSLFSLSLSRASFFPSLPLSRRISGTPLPLRNAISHTSRENAMCSTFSYMGKVARKRVDLYKRPGNNLDCNG